MKPLYKYSAETARHNGELDAWRESKKENIRCRDFLDEQIAKRFDGMTLPSDCVENTVKEFGYDRTMWVIANTIQNRKGDGRFHSRNTEWAKRFNIPDTGRNYEFALNSHSCLVDGAADDIRKENENIGKPEVPEILSQSQITEENSGENNSEIDKVIINPENSSDTNSESVSENTSDNTETEVTSDAESV